MDTIEPQKKPGTRRPAGMNPIVANLVRSLLPLARQHLGQLDQAAASRLSAVPLEDGEARAAWLLYDHGGRAMLATVALTPDDRIARLLSAEPAADFLARLIDQGGKG